tara:strand:- start:16540 stop:17235 length:696 start_codon:yes stop_codon:yes gene_type:complete
LKKVAIVQSNYLPWKGYFDMIAAVDEFILFDDAQYTRRDWRNRNLIKTPQGTKWLTIPVKVKGKYEQTIRQTEIDGIDWQAAHWTALQLNYRRAPYFNQISELLAPFYMRSEVTHLSEINSKLIGLVCEFLGIDTKISSTSDYDLAAGRSIKLADLCVQAGASEYVSGPAAKAYIDTKVFEERSVAIRWFDYSDYPPYPQLWGDFTHQVSIVDLLFNCGHDTPSYMRYVSQ